MRDFDKVRARAIKKISVKVDKLKKTEFPGVNVTK